MFELQLNPILFHVGQFEVHYYGLFMAAAFLLGYVILKKLARERGINPELMDDLVLWLIPGIILGARLVEVFIYEPAYYFADPIKILYIWQGGIASHGGILGAIIVIYFFAKKHKLRFYDLADMVCIPFALGAVFVRLGNFTNGELVGKITSVPWAVKFPKYGGFRHPSQIYEALKNIVLFGILWNVRKKNLPKGMLMWSSIFLFSFFRFFVEFFKEFPAYYELNIGQWLSVIAMVVSGYFIWKIWKKK
ncbi:prolipoprotein diacylglyceryl transferase [Candidatus Woesearchaeota archaeon]|nr:prolipoprotein diacylglyceryl transferase [Candidatus Woesearchaeota archaeon]